MTYLEIIRRGTNGLYSFWKNELNKKQKLRLVSGFIILFVIVISGIAADIISPYDAYDTNVDSRLMPPDLAHIFGTDRLGRDIFTRAIHGSRASLSTALLSVVIALIISLPLGLISGYVGKLLDRLLTLTLDALYVFPSIFIAMIVTYLLGRSSINMALAIGFSLIPATYRVIHSITLSAKERTFVESSRAIGASMWDTLLHCVLPQVLPSAVAITTLNLSSSIMYVSALGFLGLGIPPPIPEWGTDISENRQAVINGYWWNILPGLMIIVTIIGILLIGDVLDEIVNPKLKKE
ncbi:MAG: ABC transporter permease [Candidatus Hodarchaeota archaeon]